MNNETRMPDTGKREVTGGRAPDAPRAQDDVLQYQSPADRLNALRQLRRRRLRTVLWVLTTAGGIAFLFSLYFCVGLGQRNRVFEKPDAHQLIAGPDEAWLFLDIVKSVREPGIMAGASSTYTVAQVAVHFNEDGVIQTVPLTVRPGSTFNSNLAIIFALDSGLFMFESGRGFTKWSGTQFGPDDAGLEVFRKTPNLGTTPESQLNAYFDATSRANGWTPLLKENDFWRSSKTVMWNGGSYQIFLDTQTTPAKVLLERMDRGHEWSAVIATSNVNQRPAKAGE